MKKGFVEQSSYKDYRMNELNSLLKAAINKRDKRFISRLYNLYNTIDLERVSDCLFNEYDSLVDRANDILYK